jgi:caffeoyl-CoA O-methyltransferase
MTEEFTLTQINDYLEKLYDDGNPVRLAMEELAQRLDFPIIGPLVGPHLFQLTRMIDARRVFELGSGYGYSALFFARAVGPEGEIHCTELSEENIRLAKHFLTQAGLWERVTYHQEEATTALRQIGGLWDIIYNDVDKEDYPETIDLAYQHLRPGGLFITDNIFWHGRPFSQADQSPATRGVVEFTHQLFDHPGFVTTIYPVRDGLAVALRQ